MAVVRSLVTDVERALDFYTTHLGIDTGERWSSVFASASRDELELWLSGPETSAARPMPDGRQTEPSGWNRIIVTVSGLPGLVELLKAAGVTFRNDVIPRPGGSQVLVEDGAGNIVELFEPRRR
jgi:catechol 2,3-dioxygenase-like lactoylglutathione lyase family enzyme